MLLLFRKLEHVVRLLGSDVEAKYHVEPLMSDGTAGVREMLRQFGIGPADAAWRAPTQDRQHPDAGENKNVETGSVLITKVANEPGRKRMSGLSRKGLHKAFEDIGRNM